MDLDFDLEPSKHEPKEKDPEEDFYDETTDSLTIPQVSTAETDVDPALLKLFWGLVLVINVAVLFLALGLLLLFFESDLRRGGGLLVGGLVLFAFVVYRYRTTELLDSSSTDESAATTESGTDDTSS